MHAPAVKAEIDVAQNLDGPKAFRDPAKFNYRSHVKRKSGVAGVQHARDALTREKAYASCSRNAGSRGRASLPPVSFGNS
jgi:hypothetical protein